MSRVTEIRIAMGLEHKTCANCRHNGPTDKRSHCYHPLYRAHPMDERGWCYASNPDTSRQVLWEPKDD
jgi:hypothetical protein